MEFVDSILTILLPFLLIFVLNIVLVMRLRKSFNDSTPRSFTRFLLSRKNQEKINETNASSSQRLSGPTFSEIKPKQAIHHHQQQHLSTCLLSSAEISRRRKNFRHITLFLVSISTCFLLLNSLYFYDKLRILFELICVRMSSTSSSSGQQQELDPPPVLDLTDPILLQSDRDEILHHFSRYFYYLNFAVNFYLYTLLGSSTKLRFLFSRLVRKRSKSDKI